VRDLPLGGEAFRVPGRGRRDRNHLRPCKATKGLEVNRGHEPGTNKADPNSIHRLAHSLSALVVGLRLSLNGPPLSRGWQICVGMYITDQVLTYEQIWPPRNRHFRQMP
jgi:hypothetical protein